MIKATLSLFALLIIAASSHAQLRVGIIAGGHQSTVLEENDLPGWNEIESHYSGRIGIHAGFLADLAFAPNSKLYFQPGVVFHHRGRKFDQQFDPATSTVTAIKSTQYINYIDVPLNIVLKFGGKTKFIIGGGPYASFFFNGQETLKTFNDTGIQTDFKNEDLPVGKNADQYRIMNYGVNALAGVELGRVFITANYSRGLNDFYETSLYKGTFRHQVIGGSLGVFLGNPGKTPKKPSDTDHDGIPDETDLCPALAGTAITNGCPDRDGDGIADSDDACPEQAGSKVNKGCPDGDNDGINDKDDKCPSVPGLARYNGCPVPDADGDGVNDEEDNCPTVAGDQKYGGCPVPDSDEDGVNDELDKCPSVKGSAANNGCPEEVKEELVEKANYAAKKIQFQSGKAILLNTSRPVLDEIVTLLNTNPGLTLLIEGHSSAEGNLDFNMKLSADRAKSVETYLVSKGIDKNRITTKGFGPTQPLNDGNTPAERAANRRVELKLSN
jgi:outer membrane protein OmpA-like peptidoglycan-associated protein